MPSSNRLSRSTIMFGVAALLAGGLLAGCSGGNAGDDHAAAIQAEADARAAEAQAAEMPAVQSNAAPAAAPAPAAATPAAAPKPAATPRPAPAPQPTAAAAPAQPQYQPVTVPAGTLVDVAFASGLSSETSQAGDTFVATVVNPVVVDGRVAIEAGSTVSGRILEVHSSKRIGGKSKLGLQFDTLQPTTGGAETIAASFYAEGAGQTKKDAATIGGATAGGALLGRLIGDKNGGKSDGTKIGAVVGAAVGTAVAAKNAGETVEIAPDTVIAIQLDAPITL